jgi:hypothetical protein
MEASVTPFRAIAKRGAATTMARHDGVYMRPRRMKIK